MAVFKELLSVAASAFVNYFAIFEGVNLLTKQYNFCRSKMLVKRKKTLDNSKL